jgi:hypothetical protein
MLVPKTFQSILWEYNLSKLKIDSSIVVERVLNLWDKNITDFWIKEIWKEKAKKLFLKNSKLLDKKSYNYWKLVFDLRENKKIFDNRTIYEKLNTPIFSRSFG